MVSWVFPKVPPVTLFDALKLTASPETGLLLASVTVTKTEDAAAGRTVVGASSMETLAAAPATNCTLAEALKPPLLARTTALPTRVGEVSKTCAIPSAFEFTLAALSVPALVLKLTGSPSTGSPLVSTTVARKATLELPLATIWVAPVSKVRLLSSAAPALTFSMLLA